MKMKLFSIASDNNKILKFCKIYNVFLFVVLIILPSAICTAKSSGIHALTFYEYDKNGKSYATEYKYVEGKCTGEQSRLVILNDSTKKILDDFIKGRGKKHLYWVYGTGFSGCPVYTLDGEVTKSCNEQHFFICEQVEVNSVTLTNSEITITNIPTTITCTASGYPVPYITWKRNAIDISRSVSGSIYQTISSGKSILHLKNPKGTDEGNYKCQASNTYRGSKHTLSKSAKINVPSDPIIESVTGYLCNSSLVIVWKPHVRATEVKHKVTFRETLSNKEITIDQTPVRNGLNTITINNLTSSRQFTITIQPCLKFETCYSYKTTKTAMTGGVAGKVSNATLKEKEGTCWISWSRPFDLHPNAAITSYQLHTKSSPVYVPLGVKVKLTSNTTVVNASVISYMLSGLPNRNYSVYIQAETCAGLGDKTLALGESPAFIKEPRVTSTMSVNGSLEIVSKIPDESNGMIKCVFIVVQEFDSFEDSESIFKTRNLSKMDFLISETEYIAIAVERKSIPITNGEHTFLLGSDKLSYCGVKSHNNNSSEKHESFPADFYVGLNKRLRRDLSYKIFMVTATPSEKEMFFQTSSALVVKGKTEINLDLWMVAFCVAAGIFLIASIIIVALVKKLRSKSLNQCTSPENTKQKIDKENDIPQLYEYPSINIGSSRTHHVKSGAMNAEEWKSSKSEYEQVASTNQVHKAHDRHYEIPLNHYELVSK